MTAVLEPKATVRFRHLAALKGRPYADRLAICNEVDIEPGFTADSIAASGAEVVVIGPSVPEDDALLVVRCLDEQHPELVVVLVAADPTNELWDRALDAGVRRVVRNEATRTELFAVVENALDRAEKLHALLGEARQAATTPTRTARIITVLSPKGGSGKTTVATNLAAGLARYHDDQVAIVDLDLQFGDVADAFLLTPAHSLADLPAGEIDRASVKLALTPTGVGLYALCTPDDPAAGEEVPVETVAAAIDALASDLAYVVIDTGAGIDAASLTAVERSTDLVFVGSLDVPSIRSVAKLITALDRLGMSDARRHVVLNRSDSDVGISLEDVTATLGMPITIAIPSSRAVPLALNEGTPVLLANPDALVSARFHDLVAQFTDVPEQPVKRRSFRRSK